MCLGSYGLGLEGPGLEGRGLEGPGLGLESCINNLLTSLINARKIKLITVIIVIFIHHT